MGKYKIVITPKHSVEFSMTWVGKLFKRDLSPLHTFVGGLGFLVLFTFVVLFPSGSVNWQVKQSEALYWALTAVSLLIALTLCWIVLTKWQHFVDPILFLPLLVFALLIITSHLIAPGQLAVVAANTTKQLNTFGRADIKFLAGISVMSALGLFYLTNVFVNTQKKFDWVSRGLIGGLWFAIATYISFMSDEPSAQYLVPLIVLSAPVFMLFAVYTNHKVGVAAALLGTVLATVIAFRPGSSWQLLFAVLAALVTWLWVWMLANDWDIRAWLSKLGSDIPKVLRRKLGVLSFLRSSVWLVVAIASLSVVVAIVVWIVTKQADVAKEMNTIVSDVQRSARLLRDVGRVIFGNGTINGPSYANSLSYVIAFQGVLGVVAYLFLSVTSYVLAAKAMVVELRDSKSIKFAVYITPFVFAVPVLSLLTVIDPVVLFVWWVVLALLSTKLLLARKFKKIKLSTSFKLFKKDLSRFLPIVQILLIVAIAVGWVFVSKGLWNLVVRRVL